MSNKELFILRNKSIIKRNTIVVLIKTVFYKLGTVILIVRKVFTLIIEALMKSTNDTQINPCCEKDVFLVIKFIIVIRNIS